MTRSALLPLMRRTAEIDFQFQHRHLPGSLTALPIIAGIFENFDEAKDIFILSKGHSCAALYAVLESRGKKPDLTKVHPERDVANGVQITAGSLGHGLPIAVGMAYAKKLRGEPGTVHVLMGDGECQEGTTWEALNLAERIFSLDPKRPWLFISKSQHPAGSQWVESWKALRIHIDANGYQGSSKIFTNSAGYLCGVYPALKHQPPDFCRLNFFASMPEKSVHLQTPEDHAKIMEELV